MDLADYLQETEIENLYVIPAGNIPPNPSELLVSENMINLVDNLKEIFIFCRLFHFLQIVIFLKSSGELQLK